jgi:magnesium transporter
MARFLKNRTDTIGKAPGTLTFIGQRKMEKTIFRLISYSPDQFNEYECSTLDELLHRIDKNLINWINIDGVHDPEVISSVCNRFGLSPLVQEDIVNTDQRPKLIDESDKLVVILKELEFKETRKSFASDQITMILGDKLLISFQEKKGEFFNPIRERLRQKSGKLRISGSDYLLYRLIDAIADYYLVCAGELGELIEKNEETLLSKKDKAFIHRIYSYKTEISYLRKIVRPAKEVTKLLKNSDTDLIADTTRPFLDHLDDLLTQTLETVELYHSMTNDQLMIYNTNLSNRANEVMKVLTIFASIFIPLTFIVGVYGTNFEFVPEYHFKYGYFIMWGIMLGITVFMMFYFRRKKWL